MRLTRLLAAALLSGALILTAQSDIPHLRKQGSATQLIVEGKPFLSLGGELRNSSTSSLEYMKPIWGRMVGLNINTVLAPVTWETLEPEEGKFDFTLIDGMIEDAREHGLRLVILWFGTWKNGMSSYAPLWVKRDYERFPRVQVQGEGSVEIITTFSDAAREADTRAYVALMRRIRELDSNHHTVIMMQMQNEVGVLGDSRDRSPVAEKAFAQPVPPKLLAYMRQNKDKLIPELHKLWASTGFRDSGSWEQVFGSGPFTDEVFMAWNYASYMDRITAAGKAEYALPVFANAWLSGSIFGVNELPGAWPSGGPLPPVMDVWRAAAPNIDFLSPDIYQTNFEEWCDRYTQLGNPLYIPETSRGKQGAGNIFFSYGKYNTIGTSPFAVDDLDPTEAPLTATYAALRQLAPLILKHQGADQMAGFRLSRERPFVELQLGDLQVKARLVERRSVITVDDAFGLIIKTGPDQFLIAGSRALVDFKTSEYPIEKIGIGPVEEGELINGKWTAGRRLNGDETFRGHAVKLPNEEIGIQKVTVYRYK